MDAVPQVTTSVKKNFFCRISRIQFLWYCAWTLVTEYRLHQAASAWEADGRRVQSGAR